MSWSCGVRVLPRVITRRKLLRPHARPRRKTNAARSRHRPARTGPSLRRASSRSQGQWLGVSSRPESLPAAEGGVSVLPWLVMFALVVAVAGAGWIGLSPAFDREALFPLLGVAYMVDDSDSRNTLLTQGHRLSTVITTNFNLTDT